VIFGVTSTSAGFCRKLADQARLSFDPRMFPNIDSVTSVAHTEGNRVDELPNTYARLVRCLCGMMVNPNVGALLIVDVPSGAGTQGISNANIIQFFDSNPEHKRRLASIPHQFFSLTGDFLADLQSGMEIVTDWLPIVNQFYRVKCPISELKVVLQCGGSDAFSGISGNPLAAWVAKKVVQHGGQAGMAETGELIGAEDYYLSNCKDIATAQVFLEMVQRYKSELGWHGVSAEGNPSDGNKLRGLYNICLKSLGAAVKRNPQTCLDYCIEYGELMMRPGYYFMDSPGNDLESIAGQVASGANMIFFITGNGSITNFPFVPTLKIVTTSARFDMLRADMDVDAGQYLLGKPMEVLGRETLQLCIDVGSGRRCAGETFGHSQVSIWRDYQQTGITSVWNFSFETCCVCRHM